MEKVTSWSIRVNYPHKSESKQINCYLCNLCRCTQTITLLCCLPLHRHNMELSTFSWFVNLRLKTINCLFLDFLIWLKIVNCLFGCFTAAFFAEKKTLVVKQLLSDILNKNKKFKDKKKYYYFILWIRKPKNMFCKATLVNAISLWYIVCIFNMGNKFTNFKHSCVEIKLD